MRFYRSSRGRVTKREGYQIRTQRIPQDISPNNRLLIGAPADVAASL